MNHEYATYLIGDLMRGNLPTDTKGAVLTHMTDCEECKALAETYATISEAFLGTSESADEQHPSTAALVDYAMRAEGLDDGQRARIAAHLKECPSCAFDLDTTRRAETELTRRPVQGEMRDLPVRAVRSVSNLRAAIAASVVFASLAYPAYLGLFESGDAPSWPGAVTEMPLLQSPLRASTASIPTIGVDETQPVVPLAVVAPRLESEGERLRLSIKDASGSGIWSQELGKHEVDRYASIGSITLLIPSTELPDGRYSLDVMVAADQTEEKKFEAPFEIVRR